ncbi:MAG: ubiquinol-cytochrome c reductase iron-sulfur subunit [Anaerolineae bacterium]|jgi:cytochrome b6-f complex iron-sulfur subunit|nr:ubiquinol-cytochrome c reductase iron-sulfur subunit [Anaerolineae bacterium]MBT7191357.1 ubiquinol-cytochrome c reductase iron-sulfur subunit [Anaerolineae bacterium]MBT7991232.1 ubiquinol-cytochrome c reductase iron-sulfur subunit [Anaerolineae bacterium]
MSTEKISRRDFLNLAWGAAGALAVTELSFVGLRFLSPRATDGEFGGEFNLGSYESYPLGSVTPVEVGRFYLVRLQDGGFLAIYRRCTHLGCAVPFDQASGEFVCPCHGSVFTNEGDVLNQPAPRPLDLFQIAINEETEIIVDTSSPIERNQTSPDDIVYI